MKVSEAIDKVQVGDEVWAKAKITRFDEEAYDHRSIEIELFQEGYWLHENDEISLTEPKAEKVEVPQFVADWFEENKDMLDYSIWKACIDSEADYDDLEETAGNEFYDWLLNVDGRNKPNGITTLIRMKDGYTVKPKQEPKWVVKFENVAEEFYFIGWSDFYKTFNNPFVPNGHMDKTDATVFKFTDYAKAKAVATLVEGSVEEV